MLGSLVKSWTHWSSTGLNIITNMGRVSAINSPPYNVITSVGGVEEGTWVVVFLLEGGGVG